MTTGTRVWMKCRRFAHYISTDISFDCHSVSQAASLDFLYPVQVESSKRPVVSTMESTDSERPPLIAHYLYIQVSRSGKSMNTLYLRKSMDTLN